MGHRGGGVTPEQLFEPRSRVRPVPDDLSATCFDVIVIGGGINGCGIARDAAMRGLRVLLLEQRDIGSGTTAWSTRLIHGGLRYLEYGDVRLVRESLHERERLRRIAPHLVRPLRFVIPVYAGSRRNLLTIRSGLLAYDLLAGCGTTSRSLMLSRSQLTDSEPGLAHDGLRGAASYFDAQVTFPERLALENALSAQEHGACIVTYARVTRILPRRDGKVTLHIHDLLTGERLTAHGQVVVNATGPWVDATLGRQGGAALIGGTRGSHLIVERFSGAPQAAIYAEARTDHRPFFVIPWNGRYLVGTTDVQHAGDPADAIATRSEVDYLLTQTNRLFPDARLGVGNIVRTYAGVRPLPVTDARTTAAITRRHSIHHHRGAFDRVISLVGGKLTTYRLLAEQVTDRIFALLGLRDPGCATASQPLPGARPNPNARITYALPPSQYARLRSIYGSRTGFAPRHAGETLLAEVAFAFQLELAETAEDVILRRTMRGLSSDSGFDLLDTVVPAAAALLGWDARRQAIERSTYARYVQRFAVPGPAGNTPLDVESSA
jgi:glycerol-3-phosphate dehydrogenase